MKWKNEGGKSPDHRAEERLLRAGGQKAFQTRPEAKAALDDSAKRKDRNRGGKTDYYKGPGWNRKYRCDQSHKAKRTQAKTTKLLLPQNGERPPHSTASGKILLMNQEPNRLQVQRRLPKDLSHEGRGRDGSLTEPGVLPKRYVPSPRRQRGPFPRGSWKCVSQCVFNSIKCTPHNKHTHSRTCRTLSLPSRSLQPSEGVTISNAKETN